MATLDVARLTVNYGNVRVLEDVFLTSGAGECIGIIGPNGSGKSTLLKALSRIIQPATGSIVLTGRDLGTISRDELARNMAVVSQDTHSDFEFTCLDIVLMGRNPHLKRFAVEGRKDYEIAESSMRLTSTWHLKDRMFNELSGGERQRVVIARALTQEPSVLLLDEPVSHLDINHQIEILELVDRLKKTKGLLVIMVIHDLNLAARYCDRLILLNDRTVRAAGTPAEVLTREHIRDAFKADVLVRRHPMTGSIYITLMNTVKPDRAGNGRLKVHVVSGAGTGARLLYALASQGYTLTAGVLNVLDSDYDVAVELGVKTITEAPFSPITPESGALNLEAMSAADVIVVSDLPFGWGNVKNLEAVAGLAGSKPIVLVESRESRDFTDGKATELLALLTTHGALVVSSVDEAVGAVARAGERPGHHTS
jgi:iron complex transport system ATP-binding protein